MGSSRCRDVTAPEVNCRPGCMVLIDVSAPRTRPWMPLLMALVAIGCGDDGAGAAGRDAGRDLGDIAPFDASDGDRGDDAADGVEVSDVPDDADGGEVSPPDVGPGTDAGVDAGSGPGDPCLESSDCDSGQCVTLAPGGPAVCASLCSTAEDCAADEDCVLLLATGADGLRVCLALDFCLDADNDDWGVGPACLGRDCNDDDAEVNPGTNELCNGRDDDCDGVADDAPEGQGDRCDTGFVGVCSLGVTRCTDGSLVCEALEASGVDVCDGLDNDCDGSVDEAESSDRTWYRDEDGDRFGDVNSTTQACAAPAGFVDVVGDCNDGERTINPNAVEVCDGIDNDCDGTIDAGDGVLPSTWYRDNDTDGFGDPEDSVVACARPDGYVANDDDCNDRAPGLNPDATEVCDGIDNDCDGITDPVFAQGSRSWYRDNDTDGFGDPEDSVVACARPDGYAANDDDCNDRVTAVNPDAVELCDTVDNNCDGVIDPATSADASTWYVDFDNDGAGDPASATIRACAQPEGYVGVAGDCDDDDDTLPGSGARTFALDTNLPVPPSGQSTGLTVARVPVDSGGVVQGVRVQVTVLHTDTGDITITLVSPLGTRVILARERGFDDNYTQTTFSDAASATISSSSNPFTGTWRPEQPLSAFIGQDAAGDWLLEVSDRFSLENGSIRRVRLDLELGCPAEP